jgi:hypothetical protein
MRDEGLEVNDGRRRTSAAERTNRKNFENVRMLQESWLRQGSNLLVKLFLNIF